jgi:hypothetical protein
VRRRIRRDAGDRCGYCLCHQRYLFDLLELEHLTPLCHGGSNDEDNLWLACGRCNRGKGVQTAGLDPVTRESHPLYNPRRQRWQEHFQWDGALIRGLTPVGRATVAALDLNDLHVVAVRRCWAEVGWHPPDA